MTYNDFIIPLAWPEAAVRTAGGGYDKILSFFKVHRNGFYKAGHAAFLLVNAENGDIDYFDFGRYISPDKMGRARSKETDPEVAFDLKAQISKGEIINFNEIVKAIGNHPETHGSGTMYAGLQKGVNREAALKFIEKIQSPTSVPYGPFEYKGTNCSRFVAQTIAKSIKGTGRKFLYPPYLTPAPIGNIFYSSEKTLYKLETNGEVIAINIKNTIKRFAFIYNIMKFAPNEQTPDPVQISHNKVFAPKQRINVTSKAQWLGGIGAGCWYEVIESSANGIKVQRTQGNGKIDFVYNFTGNSSSINFDKPYKFEYGSQGNRVIISQNGQTHHFKYSHQAV